MAKGTLRVRIVGDASHLQKTLGSATSNLAKFAKVGVLGAAAAVAGGVALSIRAFGDFDAAMTESVAIMGDVSDAMRKDMANAAREVAKTTKFSATDAAQSYFYLASAGMDAAMSIEALPKVAAFAQAGAFDMALATDLLTDAQSALGLVVDDNAESLDNLARVGDVLVKANTLANASVQQFSEALTNKAGASMRSLNMDMEEGVAVLAVFADQGIKGSQAGTTFNATLRGLTVGVQRNAKEFKKLGVEVYDSEGALNNMADIVGDLESALDGMSVEQQRAALSQLGFTEETLAGTLALIGNSDAIREYERGLRAAGGTVDDVANKQMQTFWAKLGLVKDQLLDVALSVGQALMPALEGFADWIADKTPAITGWVQRIADKFTDLLGTTEESTAGSIVAMDSFTAMAQRRSGEVVSSIGDLEGALDSFEAHARRQLEAAGGTITIFRDDADKNLGEADEFMARLSAAWQTVWDEDLGPWLKNDVPAWIVNEFLPAVGAAMAQAGAAAGKAFLDGMWEQIKNLPGFVRQALDNADAIGGKGLGGGFQVPSIHRPGGSIKYLPTPRTGGGSFVPMARGGIIKARPGGTRVLAGEAGDDEAFMPLTPQGMADAGFGGGNTYINVQGTVVAERELLDLVERGRARGNARNGW